MGTTVKMFAFRPPEFGDKPLVAVMTAELADLDDRTLGRLADEMRHRIMIRDTMLTIERLYWPTSVSQACWTAIRDAALAELHGRALTDNTAWSGRKLEGREALSKAMGEALAARRAKEAAQATMYRRAVETIYGDDSQADNALAAERCQSIGRTKLMNTPVRCQGTTSHAGQHFNGPRIARTWWA
jgi:hypothetical protein